eukprot:3704528-Ditylum_brightwellii.AAC.1
MTERSKKNKHLVCDVDDDVGNGVGNGDNDIVDDGDDDCVDDGDKGANKHLAQLSQAADCCMTERGKQIKHVVDNEDNDVDVGVHNGDNDGVENSDDDGVNNGADSANKHLAHLSQAAD